MLLKEVGLDPQQVGKDAALLAIDRCLGQALRVRRVADPDQVKIRILQALRATTLEGPEGADPETIFGRITLRR